MSLRRVCIPIVRNKTGVKSFSDAIQFISVTPDGCKILKPNIVHNEVWAGHKIDNFMHQVDRYNGWLENGIIISDDIILAVIDGKITYWVEDKALQFTKRPIDERIFLGVLLDGSPVAYIDSVGKKRGRYLMDYEECPKKVVLRWLM